MSERGRLFFLAVQKSLDRVGVGANLDLDRAGVIHAEEFDPEFVEHCGPVFVDGFLSGEACGGGDHGADAAFLEKLGFGENGRVVATENDDIGLEGGQGVPGVGAGIGEEKDFCCGGIEECDDRFVIGL